MTIMELGALGEFLSALVVMATLIYLASEIRQTRRALLASAYQARAELQIQFGQTVFDSEYMPAILVKVDAGEALSAEEDRRWAAHMRSLYRMHENVFYQHQQGFLEAGALEASERLLRRNQENEPCRAWWETAKASFNADFVRWMDEVVLY